MIYRGVHWELVLECSQVDYKKIGNRSSALSVFEFGEPLKNAVGKEGVQEDGQGAAWTEHRWPEQVRWC